MNISDIKISFLLIVFLLCSSLNSFGSESHDQKIFDIHFRGFFFYEEKINRDKNSEESDEQLVKSEKVINKIIVKERQPDNFDSKTFVTETLIDILELPTNNKSETISFPDFTHSNDESKYHLIQQHFRQFKTAEDYKKHSDRLRGIALMSLDEQDIYNSVLADYLAMLQSEYFAYKRKDVVLKYPELDPGIATSSLAINLSKPQGREDVRSKVHDLSKKSEIIFFYTTTCPYCSKQSELLTFFSNKHSFRIRAVSLDGKTLPQFPDSQINANAAQKLNITKVPALFLSYPEYGILPLSRGLMSINEMELKLSHFYDNLSISTKGSYLNNKGPMIEPLSISDFGVEGVTYEY